MSSKDERAVMIVMRSEGNIEDSDDGGGESSSSLGSLILNSPP